MLTLARGEDGGWLADEQARPDLAGCDDIDLMGSPATNTLPVRRLNLAIDQPHLFDVAWVVLPTLQVQRSRQEYADMAPSALNTAVEAPTARCSGGPSSPSRRLASAAPVTVMNQAVPLPI